MLSVIQCIYKKRKLMYTKKVNDVSKLKELLYNLLSKLVYKAQEQVGCV